MRFTSNGLTRMLLVIVLFFSATAFAAEQMAFDQNITRRILSGSCHYVRCATVRILAPADGFVVVTATGKADFDSRSSSLGLTLARSPAVKGVSLFVITPGPKRWQGFTARNVFPVEAGGNYSFHLNGISCDGPGGGIFVDTGSITAEFYSQADVQALAAPTLRGEASEPQHRPYGPSQ